MNEETAESPLVTVIVPTLDGHRNGCVPRLMESVRGQTFRDFEIQMVTGVSPQGRAINQGAAEARGRYLLILDDDACLADGSVFQRLVDAVQSDPQIGMAGASIVLDPEATAFQRRASAQFPRFNMPVVDQITDSDYPCHGCCILPKEVFDAVGGEREDIPRGLDPDLRVRLRAAGHRVVLVPGARAYHPLPDGWKSLLRTFYRNGRGSAYARRHHPESVFETRERVDADGFQPRTSLPYRAVRFVGRLASALATGREMRLAAYGVYAIGYARGWLPFVEGKGRGH
jgi:GT2 family glycosyltransferase